MSAHKKFGGIFLKLVFQEARKQCSWQLITMVLITLVFAWEAYDKGCEVHLQADPTKLELLYESFKVKKEDFKEQQKESILEKYGRQEHLDAPPAKLLLAQTENYVEYSRYWTVIKGQEWLSPAPSTRKIWRSTIIHISGDLTGKKADGDTNAVILFSSITIVL